MTGLQPALTQQLARLQAREQVLAHAAAHLLAEHARLAAPYPCLCPICRELLKLGIEPLQAIPTPVARRRCPLLEANHG